MEFAKISRTVKGDTENALEDIKELLYKHYIRLNNIWLYYIGISGAVTIGLNEFTSWARKRGFINDVNINSADLDRIMITTNVAIHGKISNAERDLNRYEFLELIVRVANALYKDSKVC